MKNIYVAGASKEIELCEKYIDKLREVGFHSTHDWPKVIRAVGESNPRDASLEQMLKWSEEDFNGVWQAHFVWLLIPENYSLGSWIEYGAALGLRHLDNHPTERLQAIVSGDWKKSIFTSMADQRFDTHEEAFTWLVRQAI